MTTAPVRKMGLLYFQDISSTSLREHCGYQQACARAGTPPHGAFLESQEGATHFCSAPTSHGV